MRRTSIAIIIGMIGVSNVATGQRSDTLDSRPTFCWIKSAKCDIQFVTEAGAELSLISTRHSGRSPDIGNRFALTGAVMGFRADQSYGLSWTGLNSNGGTGKRFELRYRREIDPAGEVGGNLGIERWVVGTSGTSTIRHQDATGVTVAGVLDYRWVGLETRLSLLRAPVGAVNGLSVGARIREKVLWITTVLFGAGVLYFITHED